MGRGVHVILNGELLARAAALLAADDRGFLCGDGVFETLRLYEGVPFLLPAHLRRLEASRRAVGLEIPWSPQQITAWITALVARNGLAHGSGRLRLTLSRGAAPADEPGTPTLLVTADPYAPPHAEVYQCGVDVETSPQLRCAHPWHQVKSTSYQPNLWLRRQASRTSVFDVLQWNDAGHLAEGSFTNVFVVDAGGTLRTPHPEDGCLRGVTRDAVLDLAAARGLQARVGHVSRNEVASAQEMFLTGSLVEIVPVRSLDARDVGESCPGPVTRLLQQLYREMIRTQTGP